MEQSVYEGTVYRGSQEWAFKICRCGYEELACQEGFSTRLTAQAECRRQLDAYDPQARVVNHYKVRATLELTVEGDSLAAAEAVADEEFRQISESLDALWCARNGASYYSQSLIRHRLEE